MEKWEIFISHSKKDDTFANWLKEKLASVNLNVWYDNDVILYGNSILEKIDEGLKESDILILIVSKNALNSQWVKNEIKPRIHKCIKTKNAPIIPIVLDNTKPDDLFVFLEDIRYIEFPEYHPDDNKFLELLDHIGRHIKRKKFDDLPLSSHTTNPFGLRGGVEPERFILPGRIFNEIVDDISKMQSVSIIGARMLGKSSILKFLSSTKGQQYIKKKTHVDLVHFIYIDFQMLINSFDDLLEYLALKMSKQLNKERYEGNTQNEACIWIRQTLGSKTAPWIIMFDEFDKVSDFQDIDKGIFDFLRAIGQKKNCAFVISSRCKIDALELQQDVRSSPFFNIFSSHFLSVWNISAANNLMFRPYPDKDILTNFSNEDFNFVVELTACHPLLLQIACKHLFNIKESKNELIDYTELCDRYMQEAESVYKYYLNKEIRIEEEKWIHDYLQFKSEGNEIELNNLQKNTRQRKNIVIRNNLFQLGIVIDKTGPIKMARGIRLYYEMKKNVMNSDEF
jgi:hypothetical protein